VAVDRELQGFGAVPAPPRPAGGYALAEAYDPAFGQQLNEHESLRARHGPRMPVGATKRYVNQGGADGPHQAVATERVPHASFQLPPGRGQDRQARWMRAIRSWQYAAGNRGERLLGAYS
jgi:hypothetical protein